MNSATSPDVAPKPRRRFWRKLLGTVLLIAVVSLAAFIIHYLVALHAAQRELDETISSTAPIEPLVTPADLEESRKNLPDDKNSAIRLRAAAERLPKPWPSAALNDWYSRLPPAGLLEPADLNRLRTELGSAVPALAEVDELPDLPQGRFSVAWSTDFISTGLDHLTQTRASAALLEWEAQRRALDGDLRGSLRSLRGVIHAGRALADEPSGRSQLVRLGCQSATFRGLERALAQGVADPAEIEKFRSVLEDEAAQPVLLVATRGERAGIHRVFVALEDGDLPLDALMGRPSAGGLETWVNERLDRPRVLAAHAFSLRYATRLVELARLPAEQWLASSERLEVDLADTPPIGGILVKRLSKLPGACCRNQARLRCAIVALAVEEYRMAHGAWPHSLDRLCPAFLPAVPLDPFDGQPLRLRARADGIVVYSVGPDKKDDGGKLDRLNPLTPGIDLGIQLWDVEHRPHRPSSRAHE